MKLSRVFAATLSIICATIGINAQRNYSREAFINDLDTLVYLIEDVEVAPYSQLDKSKFYATVDSVKASLTDDSVSILDAYRTVARLTGMFNQGHLRTRIPDDVANMLSKSALPTEIVVKISHDHILHIDADTTVQGQRLLRGDVITTINGHKSHEITAEALKLIPGELSAYRLYNLQQEFAQFYSILYPKEKTYDLQIKRGKTTLRIKLDGTEYSKRDKQHRPSYAYHALNDSIYLFEFNCCDMDGVEKFMRRMSDSLNRADVRHLIIDVRHNSGGNSRAGDEVCRYITDKAFTGFNGLQYKLSKTLCKEYGQKFENDSVQEYWLNEYDKVLPYDEKYRFKGKTYLLQGPETFSSAANFTAAYKEYVPGLIIGEESGGVNICAGDIIGPKLPETQLIILIPWKVFYEAGSNPGDEVHGTIPDIVTEADKALDEAIRTITEI